MSILQDYEKIRKELGDKKYKALDEYIKKAGKPDKYDKGIKEVQKISDYNKLEIEKDKLHMDCRPVFLEDVVMNEKEYNKFEKWYEKRQKDIER